MHEQNESQPKAFIKILFALFTALLVVVLGYLCIQIYTIFHRTYKTETAIAYTMSDNITLKGAAVFQADRKSTRLNSSHIPLSRMPSSA